jgi:hypothetical protein
MYINCVIRSRRYVRGESKGIGRKGVYIVNLVT